MGCACGRGWGAEKAKYREQKGRGDGFYQLGSSEERLAALPSGSPTARGRIPESSGAPTGRKVPGLSHKGL